MSVNNNSIKLERVNVTLEKKHIQFFRLKCINISSWVRKQMDEEMKSYEK